MSGLLRLLVVPADAWYMLALSIRQPYAELILRGVKTIEYRSKPTRLIGQRFYIYAAKKWAGVNGHSPSLSGRGQGGGSGAMTRDAQRAGNDPTHPLTPSLNGGGNRLPTGVIVGSAVISHCTNGTPGQYEWHLKDVKRLDKPRKPKRRPQPVWFRPF